MPLVAALALLLAGLVVTWFTVPLARAARVPLLALVASLLAAVGGATLAAHTFDMPAATYWGSATGLPPGAGLLILTLGAMLLLLATREHSRGPGGPPIWLPLPFLAGSAALTFVFWAGLRARELDYLGANAQISASNLANAIHLEFQRQASLLERLAQRWTAGLVPEPVTREADAKIQLADAPGAKSLAWITPDMNTAWYYPKEGNEGLISFDQGKDAERRIALNAASHSGGAAISGTVRLDTIEPGFVIFAPVARAGNPEGWIALEFAYDRFFAALDQRVGASQHYRCTIYVGTQSVYESSPVNGSTDESQASAQEFEIQQRRVQIVLAPTHEYLDLNRNGLPDLVLTTGLGITLLLGLTVHLARAAGAGLRTTRDSNRQLMAENEERRVIEGRLKTSDERLNLALDSTAIGIFEWNVPAGEIFGNPGLWSLLGLPPNVHANIPALWESHVHPADLVAFRATRAAQLGGAKDFTDAEYRMRGPGGEWRWLSVRAKTVVAASGTPARIVGTVQDISARKRAETALGESQTAARKLSLVASKTDNLVIIAKPNGTIEWVNESFVRVMEYALDEVIGRNPAHFMTGPETSPRAIRRIRLALAHGQGISTEIVNYAKSGRRFHLQLEIQPVRDAHGVLENFIAIEADITARVEAETALRRAKTEADAASRAKSEFLASLSHEIRTPMNGVIGMTSLLLDTSLSPDQRDFVGTIRSSGEALLGIINDILDFSKIESGKFEIDHQPFELAACLEDALDLFTAQAAARKLELSHAIAADVPALLVGDAARLRQVISNLVNNAIKFTPAGRVMVEARLLPSESRSPFKPGKVAGRARLQVVVRDTGIGIPPDRLNRLFKPFSQVDSSTTRKYGGTGLGLAICHRLCTLMGGDIRVESMPGQGSAFISTIGVELLAQGRQPAPPALPPLLSPGSRVLCFDDNPVTLRWLTIFFERSGLAVLPVTTPAAAIAALRAPDAPVLAVLDLDPAPETEPLKQALATLSLPVLGLLPSGASIVPPSAHFAGFVKPLRTLPFVRALQALYQSEPGAARSSSSAPVRLLAEEIPLAVLLVEDNPVNQKVGMRFLERLGYRADVAANGREALAAFAVRHYDFVLMDIQMPEMDGFETTREIRRHQNPKRAPRIVALTANAMQSDRDQSNIVGMDGFITKPVKLQEITDAIRRLFPLPHPDGAGPDQA